VVTKNEALQTELSADKKAKKDLETAYTELEARLREKTAELEQAKEIHTKHKEVEDRLQGTVSMYSKQEKEQQKTHIELEGKLNEKIGELEQTKRALTKHKKEEELLQKSHKALEAQLKMRSSELAKSNELLAEHKKKESTAHKDHAQLESQLKELSAELSKTERIYSRLRKAKKEVKQTKEENRKLSLELRNACRKLKEAHNELLRRDRKKVKHGSLVTGITHEVKEPLSGIFQAVETLHGKFKMGDPKKEVAEDIIKKIKKFEGKIDELSNYGRKINLNLRRYNLIRCLNTNLSIMRPICRVRRVKVNRQYSPLPSMEIDDEKINQALHYVIENAIQAMPKGGILSAYAGLDEPAKAAIIKIHNTGPLAGRKRLKENRLDLGLAIARRIISKHGGRIKIENRVSGRNKGGAFIIRLPLKHQTLTKVR
jgi:nitrogen-specific signal transduction histidine kinase